MLWERMVGIRVAVATRAEAIERRIAGRVIVCPGLKRRRGGRGRIVINSVDVSSEHEVFVAPELLAARERTDHSDSYFTVHLPSSVLNISSISLPRAHQSK